MGLAYRLVGAAVALLAWFAGVVGGGDAITQRVLFAETVAMLSVVFFVRLRISRAIVVCSRDSPADCSRPSWYWGRGGVSLFGNDLLPIVPQPDRTALAIVGMASFFTAVVRAPLTGIILVTEMTASFTLLLPMLSACFAAMLVPNLLRDAPD